MRLHALVLPLVLLAGCGQPKTEESTKNTKTAEQNAIQPVDTPRVQEIAYNCIPALAVTARYDNIDPDASRALLTIDGKSYALDIDLSGSGARYTTENGRTPGTVMTWWTKGPEATLYEAPLQGTPEEEKQVATCTQKG